jgi:hypothetical protein
VPGRDRLVGAVVVLVLLAVLAATVAWRVGRDDGDTAAPSATTAPSGPGSTTTAPGDAWPAEVQPLAAFVEQQRGAPFDHPVPIEYLAESDYQAAVSQQTEDLTDEERADLETWKGQMRSLGLVSPGTDLDAATDQLYGEGTLAFYDPEDDVVKVLGEQQGGLDVAHRVTLVHELTHAWQDQRGYLDDMDELDSTLSYTLQSVVEGDATRVEDAYVDDLSSSEQSDYYDQAQEQAQQSDLSGVPDALVAGFSSAYSLGGPFAKVLDDQGGNAEVDQALADPPPAEIDLFDPVRWFDGVQPVAVPQPTVPAGAEQLDDPEDFGAVTWMMMLSERMDPRDALHTVETWAGDSSVVYRLDGRVCTAAAFRGRTPADTTTALDRLEVWAAGSPGLDARVEMVGGDATFHACEPAAGTDGPPVAGRSQVAMQYPALRVEVIWELLDSGASFPQATCFADHVVDSLTYEQMDSGAVYDPDTVERLGSEASQLCLD